MVDARETAMSCGRRLLASLEEASQKIQRGKRELEEDMMRLRSWIDTLASGANAEMEKVWQVNQNPRVMDGFISYVELTRRERGRLARLYHSFFVSLLEVMVQMRKWKGGSVVVG